MPSTIGRGSVSTFLGNGYSGVPTIPQFPQTAHQFNPPFSPAWPNNVSQNPFAGPNNFNPDNATWNTDLNLMDIDPQATFETGFSQNHNAPQPNPPEMGASVVERQSDEGTLNTTNDPLVSTLLSRHPVLRSDPVRLQSFVEDTELFWQIRFAQQPAEPNSNPLENTIPAISSQNWDSSQLLPPTQQENQPDNAPSLDESSPPSHFTEQFDYGPPPQTCDEPGSFTKALGYLDESAFSATVTSPPSSPEITVKK